MTDMETNFDGTENNSLGIIPYQFKPLVQSSSGNIIGETASSEGESEDGGVEEQHASE